MIKLKSFKQTKPWTCGPACLKIVLDYYGIKKTEKELAKLCHTNKIYGTKSKDLVRVGKVFGLKGFVKEFCEIKDIKRHIQKKIPVIINWFSGFDGHYSVVFDIDNKNIYFKDPETGRSVKMSIYTFQKVWFGMKKDILKSKNDLYLRRIIVIKN